MGYALLQKLGSQRVSKDVQAFGAVQPSSTRQSLCSIPPMDQEQRQRFSSSPTPCRLIGVFGVYADVFLFVELGDPDWKELMPIIT
eukprot:11178930-Lingulodinium_polyedra.AAC.1